MGDVKKLFGVDETKETEGVWVQLTEDVKVKIARIGNPLYSKHVQRLLRPHRLAARRGNVADEIVENAITDAMAKTILLDWEGLEEDGRTLVHSYQEAKRLLTTFREFREQISEIANEIESFRLEEDEDTEKN